MTTLYILTLVCMVGAFFICGIPFGYVVAGREGVDVRKVGSGNIGMTNVARTVGGKAAGITFLGDMGKGLVSMLLARWLCDGEEAYFCNWYDRKKPLLREGAADESK